MESKLLPLAGKTVLITGAARRIGRTLALAAAKIGADIVIHHGHSHREAEETGKAIEALGRKAYIIQCDLNSQQNTSDLFYKACSYGPIYALVNNASIFEPVNVYTATYEDWQKHLNINLTAPFLLSQAMAKQTPSGTNARIINILDWRALRPGVDHFPYTITKAALAAMTSALAAAFAPNITVNGIALGAILPPSDGQNLQFDILKNVPAGRWANLDEVAETLQFLLTGPDYITGEIIHLDGGRHLI